MQIEVWWAVGKSHAKDAAILRVWLGRPELKFAAVELLGDRGQAGIRGQAVDACQRGGAALEQAAAGQPRTRGCGFMHFLPPFGLPRTKDSML